VAERSWLGHTATRTVPEPERRARLTTLLGVAHERLADLLRVRPGHAAGLAGRDPGDRLGFANKEAGLERMGELVARISLLHNRLRAEAQHSLLIVLQGLDASGKDGTISHVFTGISPQGLRVVSFRQPTEPELAHDYLWRVHAQCPARGELVIFNRSHYEDVVVARVRELVPKRVWSKRYRHLREFERLLADEGTTLVKVFLNLSEAEQGRRLQERLDDPEKAWKFRLGDLADRARWGEFIQAYDDAITETSTGCAPWHVVPADHNWVRNLAVAELVAGTLERLDPKLPAPDPSLRDVRVI
jgi:PPK2 family polyphosphate:nucleotide phosphotransferase